MAYFDKMSERISNRNKTSKSKKSVGMVSCHNSKPLLEPYYSLKSMCTDQKSSGKIPYNNVHLALVVLFRL